MTIILALCVSIAALLAFAWLARVRLRRGGGGGHRHRRYFSVDLAEGPATGSVDPRSKP